MKGEEVGTCLETEGEVRSKCEEVLRRSHEVLKRSQEVLKRCSRGVEKAR